MIRQSKKENIIHQMVTYEGFRREECVGTKDQLLNKLQRCRPFVTFKIDGREGIQRVLNTALHQFGWSCDHMYTATMPLRGTSTIGTRTFKDIFDYMADYTADDYSRQFFQENYRNRIKTKLSYDFAHLFQWQRDEILEDIMDFTIGLSQIAPRRSFCGSSLDLETSVDCDMFDERYNKKLFLSLNDLALRKGDRIFYKYDFGHPSIFIAEIVKCDENQPLLPETFVENRSAAVRAIVVEESTNKIPPQYPISDDDDDFDDFDSHSDY
jgi:hypothetical protein